MRKPIYAICEQQRRRSACVSAQSISEFSSLYLVSVAAQPGLSLTWSQTPKTGFLVTRLKSQRTYKLTVQSKVAVANDAVFFYLCCSCLWIQRQVNKGNVHCCFWCCNMMTIGNRKGYGKNAISFDRVYLMFELQFGRYMRTRTTSFFHKHEIDSIYSVSIYVHI